MKESNTRVKEFNQVLKTLPELDNHFPQNQNSWIIGGILVPYQVTFWMLGWSSETKPGIFLSSEGMYFILVDDSSGFKEDDRFLLK